MQKGRGAASLPWGLEGWAPGEAGAPPGGAGAPGPHPHGAPSLHSYSCDFKGPRASETSCHLGEVVGRLPPCLPLSLFASPSLPLSGTPGPLITPGRRYRPGRILPPKPAGLLHTNGWQPAPFDKLYQAKPEHGRSVQPLSQISLLLPSCSPPPPPLEPGALPVSWLGTNSSQTPGRWEGATLRPARRKIWKSRVRPTIPTPGAPPLGVPPDLPQRSRGP